MNFRAKLVSIVASLALMVTLVLGTATPAMAAKSDCSNYAGTVCLFAFGGFGNPIWRQFPDQINGCRSLVGTGWNDVTSHVMNNTSGGYTLEVWQHSNCTGWVIDVTSGYNVSFVGYGHDNNASAVRIIAF